ncbi:unnamed protein product, partial [Sphagnum troendelagicum]
LYSKALSTLMPSLLAASSNKLMPAFTEALDLRMCLKFGCLQSCVKISLSPASSPS